MQKSTAQASTAAKALLNAKRLLALARVKTAAKVTVGFSRPAQQNAPKPAAP